MGLAFQELHWSRHIPVRDYLRPRSLAEALEMLAKANGAGRVIAGGTDIIPELRRRRKEASVLVDITRLPELNFIEQRGGSVIIGGLVTHTQVASSPVIAKAAPLLATAAAALGSPQIRNVGTVAGNLVSGQPAADTSVPLLALNAVAIAANPEGERTIPLTEFFLGLGRTSLDSTREILVRIEFEALGPHHGSCYLRLSKRKAMTLPMLVCATVVETDAERKVIRNAAIAMGPVAPTPIRIREVEKNLVGGPVDLKRIESAAELALTECTPRDSCLRGSCDYRSEMVKVYIRRGLCKALESLGANIGQGGEQ